MEFFVITRVLISSAHLFRDSPFWGLVLLALVTAILTLRVRSKPPKALATIVPVDTSKPGIYSPWLPSGIAPAEDLCFSGTYGLARGRFRKLARRRGATMYALGVSEQGRRGEKLTVDIAWFGPEKPRSVLIHLCGSKGGFEASAIQVSWLRMRSAVPAQTAILLVHALDPVGMACKGQSVTATDGRDQLQKFIKLHFSDVKRMVLVDVRTDKGGKYEWREETLEASGTDGERLKRFFPESEVVAETDSEFFQPSTVAELYYLRQVFDMTDEIAAMELLEAGRRLLARATELACGIAGEIQHE